MSDRRAGELRRPRGSCPLLELTPARRGARRQVASLSAGHPLSRDQQAVAGRPGDGLAQERPAGASALRWAGERLSGRADGRGCGRSSILGHPGAFSGRRPASPHCANRDTLKSFTRFRWRVRSGREAAPHAQHSPSRAHPRRPLRARAVRQRPEHVTAASASKRTNGTRYSGTSTGRASAANRRATPGRSEPATGRRSEPATGRRSRGLVRRWLQTVGHLGSLEAASRPDG